MYLTVTQTHSDYEGSLGIPESLMAAAGIQQYERITIAVRRTGVRWETYAVPCEEGECHALGIATHYAQQDDELLVMTWRSVPEDAVPPEPLVLHPDRGNRLP